MADPVGHPVAHDHDYLTRRPQYKTEPANATTVRDVLAEQREADLRLGKAEADRLANKRLASIKRMELEKVQDRVRRDSQRLIAKLWAVPAKDWTERQVEVYSVISNWLDEEYK